jgi:hypothetical protein
MYACLNRNNDKQRILKQGHLYGLIFAVSSKEAESTAFSPEKTNHTQFNTWISSYLDYEDPTLSNSAHSTASQFIYNHYSKLPEQTNEQDENEKTDSESENELNENKESNATTKTKPTSKIDPIGKQRVKKFMKVVNYEISPAFCKRIIQTYTKKMISSSIHSWDMVLLVSKL